jgi:hypothetical protein
VSLSDDGRRSDGYERRGDGSVALLTLASGAGRMPRTVGDCRGPGICPVFRCRFNIALHVTDAGTIITGGRGCTGDGASLPVARRGAGAVKMEDLDAVAQHIVDRLMRLESSCALDYAEKGGMSMPAIGATMGVSRQAVKKAIMKAHAALARDEDLAESFVELTGRFR